MNSSISATCGSELAWLANLPEDAIDSAIAERSLYEFTIQAWPHIESADYVDNWHVKLICDHLQAVSEGKLSKLLINIPPGCSKSLLTCVFWPAWEWARNPSVRWFFASYDQRLSTRDSVKCRALIESNWYQKRWPVVFANDQNQKTYYETEEGGYRLATSVGGHGTGEHPDRKVYDDPHDVAGAESEAERLSTLEWFDLTMGTRGASRRATEVIIMQRLHDNDLSGHVAKKGGWVHVCLPMRYERGRMEPTPGVGGDPRDKDGELLTPKQFPEEMVADLETRLGPYGTAGQLAQRPRPKGGAVFKPHWLRHYRIDHMGTVHLDGKRYPIAAMTNRFGTVDFAFTAEETQKSEPDYTVVSSWAETPDGYLLWLGCYRDRLELPDIPERIEQQYRRHKLKKVYTEANGPQKGAYQQVRRHRMGDGRTMNVIPFQPVSRETLSSSADIIGMAAASRLWLPEDDPTFPLADVEGELLTFTGDGKKDKHDDIVITAVMAGAVVCREREGAGGSSSFRSKTLGAR